jgi:hypothetical protein
VYERKCCLRDWLVVIAGGILLERSSYVVGIEIIQRKSKMGHWSWLSGDKRGSDIDMHGAIPSSICCMQRPCYGRRILSQE